MIFRPFPARPYRATGAGPRDQIEVLMSDRNLPKSQEAWNHFADRLKQIGAKIEWRAAEPCGTEVEVLFLPGARDRRLRTDE